MLTPNASLTSFLNCRISILHRFGHFLICFNIRLSFFFFLTTHQFYLSNADNSYIIHKDATNLHIAIKCQRLQINSTLLKLCHNASVRTSSKNLMIVKIFSDRQRISAISRATSVIAHATADQIRLFTICLKIHKKETKMLPISFHSKSRFFHTFLLQIFSINFHTFAETIAIG